MKKKISFSRALRGELSLPGDKSISHRAAIFNGIARGKATISNFSNGEDCKSTQNCLKALGVKITSAENTSDTIVIEGKGRSSLKEPPDILDAGNSGTTMRLLSGLLAAQPFYTVITGDESLRSRPMKRIIEPLRLMGAAISGRNNDTQAPLGIKGGKLHGFDYRLPVASAQVKSSIILAALFADSATKIIEPAMSRDHTEQLLSYMGAQIKRNNNTLDITPLSNDLVPFDINVPADISSAAYWLVAAIIHPKAEIKILNCGINPTRTGILEVLSNMGAIFSLNNKRVEGGEPVADIVVSSSNLQGTLIQGDIIPRLIDEIPVIALAACFATGKTIIKDATELRAKESDRIKTTTIELSKMGANIEEMPDGMIINGPCPLKGGFTDSHYDHRLAMTLAVAGMVSQNATVIDNAQATEVSYPSFWEDLARLEKAV
ncbi:3-phosphoshikimate 1-carboxyvinyltransferase [Chloroflexota bacterium]